MFNWRTRAQTDAELSVTITSRAIARCFAIRTIDEPISPAPITVRRSNIGVESGCNSVSATALLSVSAHEFAKIFGDRAIGFLGPYSDPDGVRKIVGCDAAHDDAPVGKKLISRGCVVGAVC